MERSNHRGDVCLATASIEAAAKLFACAPADTAAHVAGMTRAIEALLRARSEPSLLREDIEMLRLQVSRLNALFHNASGFYAGWCALAAVGEGDCSPGSVAVFG